MTSQLCQKAMGLFGSKENTILTESIIPSISIRILKGWKGAVLTTMSEFYLTCDTHLFQDEEEKRSNQKTTTSASFGYVREQMVRPEIRIESNPEPNENTTPSNSTQHFVGYVRRKMVCG